MGGGITAKRRLENPGPVQHSQKLVPSVTCIYSPFVMPEILCPNFPVSRAFLGMSPVPLLSHLTFNPAFLTVYWIWSLHLLRLKSSTSSSFSDLDSDPRVLSGTQLQTHPSCLVGHQVQLGFFYSKYCPLTSFLCFRTTPTLV